MSRLTLVVNPAATGVGAELRTKVVDALSADHTLSVVETARRGDATALAAAAAADGVEVVVSLGGDGTANEAANGLAGTTTALVALPGGSTNVFSRTVGFPNDPLEAVGVLLTALSGGARRRVGLGSANGRRFLFHAGIGFDARVIQLVERHAWAKRTVGPLAFAGAAAAVWLGSRDHAAFAVEVGDETIGGRFAVCLNTDPYTYLGDRPLTMAPEAGLDQPLALVVLRDIGLTTLLPALCSALHDSSRLRKLEGVEVRTGLDRAVITAGAPVGHQVDGDFLGETDCLEIRHEPDGLHLVVPADAGLR
ncbi:MAG: diacylglycerol/lipid kinase family protein [Acidimicrobiales bacterium]